MQIEFTIALRPCLYNKQKALFHGFDNLMKVVSPFYSAILGHSQGGQYSETFAIIELENGDLIRVPYHEIKFCDSKEMFSQYDFGEDNNK